MPEEILTPAEIAEIAKGSRLINIDLLIALRDALAASKEEKDA